ncbi:putative mediator of rna polymerase ii transcription subunit 4 protein [Lasiodiplodia theobromae]|uniref:Mediator of RNA polymerase II transcription subunit 4 n=1 Tax=Lasiodiplodia theobromae TaxID=45133 RepID=A0A5N5DCV8_9PEZI|nr:Mediator of RNA polymerase II transcription subunit 4 [Lasiodiplodia theobromae]KAF9630741.1 putative mediator of rna polymerase ii transcription subunit 4 protein [Lasiodiplodia theobromae]
MDALLDKHFQRVETALNTLIDSIASYNPSQQAVVDLVAADDELSRGLEQLAAHQANYQRILALRQTADALDSQVKSTLSLLADTRRELIATPATGPAPNARDVTTAELLAYAKHIGKFTVPPNFRPPPRKEDAAASAQDKADEDVTMTNGAAAAAPEPQQTEATEEETRTMATLNAEQKAWLAGLGALPWFPWPTEDKIRQGALGQIQTMVEQGKDPTTVLSPEEQEERARKAAEEEEEQRQEEERRRAEMDQRRREMHASRNKPDGQGEQPAVFGGLDLY